MHLECPHCGTRFVSPGPQAECPNCKAPVDADDVRPSLSVRVAPDYDAILRDYENPELRRRFAGIFARRAAAGFGIGCLMGLAALLAFAACGGVALALLMSKS